MSESNLNVLDCDGYRALLAAVESDEKHAPSIHRYREKLTFAVNRARHYAEKTGLTPETILDAWEKRRSYWYMNYYQDANMPRIEGGVCRVFENEAELLEAVGKKGFRCPHCGQVSKNPYACDVAPCDWKAGGLFRTLGKGVTVFVKTVIRGEHIFMPVAWESEVNHV